MFLFSKVNFLSESFQNLKVEFQISFMLCIFSNWGVVTLEKGLHEKSCSADHTHTYKNPQEEAVNHHGHIFPVFNDLQKIREDVKCHCFIHNLEMTINCSSS